MTPEKAKEDMYDQLIIHTSWPKERIKALLKSTFGEVFELEKMEDYIAHIKMVYFSSIPPSHVLRSSEGDTTTNFIEGFLCPICGAAVSPDRALSTKTNKIMGWKCSTHNRLHYYQWRFNETHRKMKRPILFEEQTE